MLYEVALFVHIGGVLIMFMSAGLEVTVLRGLRHARSVEQARVWLNAGRATRTLFPLSAALILIGGLYMTLTAWGFRTAWIDVAFVTLIVLSTLGPTMNARRFRAIAEAAGGGAGYDGTAITTALYRQIHDPVLWASVHVMAGAALGVVFLMTVKPGLLGSLTTLAVAIVASGLVAIATNSRERVAPPASPAVPAAAANLPPAL